MRARRALGTAVSLTLAGALGAAGASSRAVAQELVTTVTGAFLVSDPLGLGGGGTLALASQVAEVGPTGVLRLGGVFGGAALTSDDDQVVRAFGLVGPQGELAFAVRDTELAARLGVGLWAGALDEQLDAGGWVSGGLWWCLRAGDLVRVGVGVDVGFVFGPGADLVVYAPGVTVAWTLPPVEDAW